MKKCIDCGADKSRKGQYCKPCGYKHRKRPSGLKYKKHKENPTSFKNGNIPWNLGKSLKEDGEYSRKEHSYLHKWLRKKYGVPIICEHCGEDRPNRVQYANKTGKYFRKRSDWLQLCVKCHQRYDYEKFGLRKVFYE